MLSRRLLEVVAPVAVAVVRSIVIPLVGWSLWTVFGHRIIYTPSRTDGPPHRRMENRRGHTVGMAAIARSLTRAELAMTLPSSSTGQGRAISNQKCLIGTTILRKTSAVKF